MAKKHTGKNSITSLEVKHVAELARLSLKKGERKKFIDQLSEIFEYIAQIGKMKTHNVPATSHVIGIANRFRKDRIASQEKNTQLTPKEALSGAREKQNGYFVVKSVFGGQEDETS